MLQQVNQIRKSNGLNELQLNIPLIKASNWQASNQVKMNKISHDGPEGTYTQGMKLTKGNAPHDQRVLACKFTGWPWGENTAEGHVNITNVMTDWMKSEGHKENILRAESKYFGAAKVGKYWVQSFGKDN
ncbi:hypothetical protein CONCODRAFT_74328 [Conidiobolus coronatus NRRL 28638]|uniref:SCP domain-containing protein n=1 Tax=Conidiobolus coronatus (strain ATCC 28846 / CBS 209.66 / NRRL 28638) TaxID=796925 RepID=A0A137NRP0_CONC2|nr:hypothetical protein CONCODRAFT_74328 [Conidiobolus coronatus NRRL 28638]|eukprot:KXN65350.1 hypothetical protein CONCODRAFT_74328 [Conidiobolus coronatus NRRL 28638]